MSGRRLRVATRRDCNRGRGMVIFAGPGTQRPTGVDPVTQIALGATIGHVTLGARVGRKALLWGGILAGIPDLDVLVPHADAVSAVTEHRGFSHSLIVHTVVAPAVGFALARLHRADAAGVPGWALLAWLAFVTHALLDACTVYGTQLFWPGTGPPAGLGNIFVIDPLYTMVLLFAVGWAASPRCVRAAGVRICATGLVVSSLYLVLGYALQQRVEVIASASAPGTGTTSGPFLAAPTPFNLVLWRVIAMTPDGYVEGYYSFLDTHPVIEFVHHRSDESLLEPIEDAPAVARLRWFTKGFMRVTEHRGSIVVTDLRMGMEPRYAFSYVVAERSGGVTRAVVPRRGPVPGLELADLPAMWRRLTGR